jgi:NAD(P)H-dependent flavin oxidoreductase YrpB (nitropropane dioxygenase family)
VGTQVNERRLSQAIAEGDGISVIVAVEEPGAARDAEQAGAEAVLVRSARSEQLASIREATELPILVFFSGEEAEQLRGADACIVDVRHEDRNWLDGVRSRLADRFELAPRICTDEHLEFVLEEFDPEVLVLGSEGREPLAGALELLPDVPAGKLAIADVGAHTREEVLELERAGMDGVIVAAGNIAHLVGAAPPEV